MKKLLILLLVIASLTTGCAYNVEILTPEVSQPASRPTGETPTFVSASATPTQPIQISSPQFDEVRFVLSSIDDGGGSYFPDGTKQVFAIWKYQNMRDGMTVWTLANL